MRITRTVCLLSLVLVIALCGTAWGQPETETGKKILGEDVPTIAIMNFDNITRNPQFDWLAFGIAETLTTKLTKVRSIKIIERSQIAKILQEQGFQGSGFVDQKTAIETAKVLGVKSLIIGSFQVLDSTIIINARLVDVATGEIQEGFEAEEKTDNIAELYLLLSNEILSGFKDVNKGVVVTQEEQKEIARPETSNFRAYELNTRANLILFGKEEAIGYSKEYIPEKDLLQAESYVVEALKLDPSFAEAHFNYGLILGKLGKADESLNQYNQALRLRPNYAEARHTLAIRYYNEYDYEHATLEWNRAIQGNPNYAPPYLGLGFMAYNNRDYALAQSYFTQALDTGPIGSIRANVLVGLGDVYWAEGQPEKAIETFTDALSADKDYTDAFIERGAVLDELGRYDEAASDLNRAIAINPNTYKAMNILGDVYSHMGKQDEADKLYDKVANESGDQGLISDAWVKKGYLKLNAGAYEEALGYFNKGVDSAPNDAFRAVAINARGLVYDYQGKDELALSEYLQAARLNPKDVVISLNAGAIYERMENYDAAERIYKEATSRVPDSYKPRESLAKLYKLLSRNDEAVIEYRKAIELNPTNGLLHNDLGILYYNMDRNQEAVASYKNSLLYIPTDPVVHSNIGLAYEAMGELEKALSAYKESIGLDPTYEPAHQYSAIVNNNLGRFTDALDAARRAIELNPDDARAHFEAGKALWNLNDRDGAETHFSKALTLDPSLESVIAEITGTTLPPTEPTDGEYLTEADKHYNTGTDLLNEGRYEEAIPEFKRAIELDDSDPDFHNNLGLCYLRLERYDEAKPEFYRCLELNENYALAHLNLGIIFDIQGDSKNAIRYLRRFVELAPDHPSADYARQRVKELGG